jgi:hypothetical protein
VEAPKGRRDEFVDPYFKGAKPDAVVVVLKAREPARIMLTIGDNTANRRSHSGGSFNTTSISTTANGAACLFACAPSFRSQRASVSINITAWQIGCAKKASILCNVPTHSAQGLLAREHEAAKVSRLDLLRNYRPRTEAVPQERANDAQSLPPRRITPCGHR